MISEQIDRNPQFSLTENSKLKYEYSGKKSQ